MFMETQGLLKTRPLKLKIKIKAIDAYKVRERGGWGTSCTSPKDFKKFGYKNAIKNENRGPPPRFSQNPKYPLKRI